MKRLETKYRIFKNGKSVGQCRQIFQDESGKYFLKVKGEWKELNMKLNKNDYMIFSLVE